MTKSDSLGSSVDLLFQFCCSLNKRKLGGILRNKALTWDAEEKYIAIIRLEVPCITVVYLDVPSREVSHFYGKSFLKVKPLSSLGNKGEKPPIL